MLLPVRSGFCSEPDSANSFSMIFWVSTNQVWSWPVAHDVRERAERVEAGEQRHRQPLPGRVEPQRRRPGQDADAVVGPDRVPVADALDVVPHAVGVDDVRRRRASAISSIRPSTCAGTPEIMCCGGVAEPLRPVAAHEVVVAADAAGGDDHRLRARARTSPTAARELACAARARRSARAPSPRTPSTAPPVDDQLVDPVAEAQLDEPASRPPRARGARTARPRPGPVPQVTWKRGTELPCPVAR